MEDQVAFMEAILDAPAMQPPLGVVPNFADPGGSQSIGYGIVIASSIISTVAVLVRLISSIALKKFLIEDVLMVAALGLFAGNQYVVYDLSIYPGFWVHQWNIQTRFMVNFLYASNLFVLYLSPETGTDIAKKIHLFAIMYGPIAMCIKVAILMEWLRIFVPAGQRNATFWISHTLIWVNVLFYIIVTFTEIFRCWPREAIWNPFFEGGSCPIDVNAQNIVVSVLNFISDLAILAMPQWVIWKLQISRSRKWGLSFLFFIGIGAWAFGVIRTVYFVRLLSSDDVVYQMSSVGIWSTWEVTAGFLIMGIPAFPRAAKSLPMSDSIASFLRSLSGRSRSDSRRPGIPQWQLYRPKLRRRRSAWEISELETRDIVSPKSAENDSSHSRINETPMELVTKKGASCNGMQVV